ncbi:hypothetical protein BJ878DRAFT_424702, partial [Calycina marina]
SSDFDLTVLKSSPPDGTELRTANSVFDSAPSSSDYSLTSPTRRYARRMASLVERQNAELILLRKQLEDQKAILDTRNSHKKGKRVKLQGQFVFSTEDVLKIVREAEKAPVAKRPRGRPRKRPMEEVEEDEEDEPVEPGFANSDSEESAIVVDTGEL